MQHVTLALPDELSAALAAPGQDLSRAAFEASLAYAKTRVQFGRPIGTHQGLNFMLADMAAAVASYRERKISAAQLRQLLGYETRIEVDAFLKNHGVELEYAMEDLERDRETHRRLGL